MRYQDDNYYIDRILSGDASAYSSLVAKHKNLVFSIALKILENREDAEEVAQDCFVKAFHALKTFERKSKFSTWLYRIVYNAAISRTRKKRLDTVPIDNQVVLNYSEDDLREGMDGIDLEDRRKMVDKVLQNLPAGDSLLINLFYRSDNSIDEISNITGLSASNVKVRLHRIRKRMHDELVGMMNKAMHT